MLAARAFEWFLDDAARSLALRRVEDPALSQPERDVVRLSRRAEADEVASAELALVDWLRGGFLLVSVSRNEVTEPARSEEHTSELQSHVNLVCRLLLEKKKKYSNNIKTSKKNSINILYY